TETPQNVTYVYKLAKGDVTVTYKDTEGNKIPGYETPKTVESQSPTGKEYTTATEALKPAKITTPSGKVYNLVPARTEGTESGKVTETPQNVTYVYELAKGDVTVTYKDTEGNKIPGYETPKTVESQSPTGKEYTTATEALKPAKITTPSGKVYNLVPESTEGNETGKVTETPQNVTYVYKLAKGDVTVTYKDTEGNKIEGYETPKDAEKAAPTGKDFNTATEALKPAKITTPSGKVYNLVPARTEGTESGKVTETPQNVTYVYELAKGNVTVTYKDTEGNTIEGYETPKDAEKDAPTGKDFNTATEALKPSKITTPSGKVYNLVPARTEGTESGKVTETPQNVTYVYEEVKEPETKQKYGKVIVTYIDKDGHPLSGTTENGIKVDKSVVDTPESLVKTLYDTTDHKPATIITENGDVYEFVKKSETSDPESGELKEGVTTVEYVYRKVVTTYVDETGKEINPSDKGTKDKKDIPEYTFKETKKDKDGNTIHVYTKKSSSTPYSPTPSTPSNEESKSTVWKDTEGNVLKPQEDGTKDKGTFTGYEYVKTILVGNVTTHIFKKVITPIHDETPSHSDVPGQSDIPAHSDVTTTSDKSTQIVNSNESTFVDGKRELPNTGTQSSTSSLLLGALAAITGLGLVSRRRKDDKE
ncbi:MucBP domain-containing protein, partial [uncultured Streptococcus sp.]|uniref:MucBP domain-containing protein n=1 Tax=uncultured Streptococcus sp. TaxID=83427 RepID=UPI0028D53DBB